MVGALLLTRNCWLLHLHKDVKGVSVLTTAFFTLWGGWNLYFYPANNLPISFAGALCLAGANLTWVIMALRIARMETRQKYVCHDSFWNEMPGLVWSNRNASDDVQIAAALLNPRFLQLLAIAEKFGTDRLQHVWDTLKRESPEEAQRAAPHTQRMLDNIHEGERLASIESN